MSLMKMRERRQRAAAKSFPGREFRRPPSVGRVVLHALMAAAIGGLSLRSLLEGNERAAFGVMLAAVFALLAIVNAQRLKEALLPARILCPSCEAPIALSPKERRQACFACPSCREDFEVTDEEPS